MEIMALCMHSGDFQQTQCPEKTIHQDSRCSEELLLGHQSCIYMLETLMLRSKSGLKGNLFKSSQAGFINLISIYICSAAVQVASRDGLHYCKISRAAISMQGLAETMY